MDIFFKFEIPYILFYIITFFWILEFIVFPSKYESNDYSEKKSFQIILTIIISTISLTIITTFFGFLTFSNELEIFRIIGIISYTIGILLRYISTLTLGRYFTRNVEVSKDQQLISHGPYRLLRHPLYLGLFLLLISVPLFFANWGMFIIGTIAIGLILNQRMKIEEASMEAVLGKSYSEWKAKRYRFIPFIY